MPGSIKDLESDRQGPAAQAFAYKLTAPRVDQKAIRRSELLARIMDNPATRVVVLQAPAGHGKTTLLQQLRLSCEARDDITGWLSVDESNNDIHRFYQHLGAMISGMESRSESSAVSAGDEGQRDYRADWLISRLLHIGRPCSIFLDDLHTISARQTLSLLRESVAHVPDNVQVFIASRTLPDLGLSRLTVSEEALIVRAEDLCFSPSETRTYFSSLSSLHLTEEEVGMIQTQTDGWPAALQLFRLALRNPSIRQGLNRLSYDRSRDLTDYLAENVLVQQSPAMRDFLVRSSVLSRMSGPLCDEVLGVDNSEEHLLSLEHSGLFVRRVEGASRWFTYHPLFRSFLKDQLTAKSAATVAELQRRAADWFDRHDDPEEALQHYVDAGDHEQSARVLDAWALRLVPAAHMMTVERWSESIPLAEIEKRPDLVVKVVWALTFLRRHTRLAPLVAMLERIRAAGIESSIDPRVVLCMVAIFHDRLAHSETIVADINVKAAPPTAFDAFQWGAVCNARGYASMAAGDFAAAHEHLARSRVLSDPSAASFTWAYGLSLTGIAFVSQGLLQESLSLHRTCMQDPRMYVDESIAQASLVSSHVMALYEANRLAEAEKEFLRFRDVIANAAFHDHLAIAYIAMCRIHDALGQQSKALEMLDEAEAISYASHWPRIGEVVLWERRPSRARERRLPARQGARRSRRAAQRRSHGSRGLDPIFGRGSRFRHRSPSTQSLLPRSRRGTAGDHPGNRHSSTERSRVPTDQAAPIRRDRRPSETQGLWQPPLLARGSADRRTGPVRSLLP
jgi:LuxR family transcriptional regulator, maltose regulon positive regulatory protein